MNKKAPWILLMTLFVILIFILGVRYGQSVEKTNKQVSQLLSITPTKPPVTPTSIAYKEYKSVFCGVQFVIPSDLKVEETTPSARFTRTGKELLEYTCETTPSAQFKNRKFNTLNGKNIHYNADSSILPLFENSLKFTLR